MSSWRNSGLPSILRPRLPFVIFSPQTQELHRPFQAERTARSFTRSQPSDDAGAAASELPNTASAFPPDLESIVPDRQPSRRRHRATALASSGHVRSLCPHRLCPATRQAPCPTACHHTDQCYGRSGGDAQRCSCPVVFSRNRHLPRAHSAVGATSCALLAHAYGLWLPSRIPHAGSDCPGAAPSDDRRRHAHHQG